MKFFKPIKSQKGTTIIIISIIVTSIIMLIVVAASESIRQALKRQGVQKKSLELIYDAEEGIEYSYFVTENEIDVTSGTHNDYLLNAPYNLKLWHSGEEVTGDNVGIVQAMQTGESYEDYILVSESNEEGEDHKKTIFTRNPFIPEPEVP